ncbi:MAG: purine-nucleoside phosphorylase [Clostridia bacterium]|nr:purine-nucleoside phosphorylase [Clostridia bacterium]
MDKYYKSLKSNKEYIESKIKKQPEIAIVLGSGLGSLAEEFSGSISISYSELANFPISTVSGHSGQFVFTEAYGKQIVMMQGRVHYYEGYSMQEVVKPIRLLKMLGVEKLILTNSAGGINDKFEPGNLMMISGHISSFVPSPLLGKNEDLFGTRFPDMSNVYNKELQKIVSKSALEENIEIQKGIYLQTTGPQYETPEEIRMFKLFGADAVGMSTVCEAIAAVHCGMEVCGISCITNKAAGITPSPLTHEEVKEAANSASQNFKKLIKRILYNLGD